MQEDEDEAKASKFPHKETKANDDFPYPEQEDEIFDSHPTCGPLDEFFRGADVKDFEQSIPKKDDPERNAKQKDRSFSQIVGDFFLIMEVAFLETQMILPKTKTMRAKRRVRGIA